MSQPSASSLHDYQIDWRLFCTWCAALALDPIHCQSDDIGRYLCDLLADGRRLSTVARRRAAIAYYQRRAGLPHPGCDDRRLSSLMAELREGAAVPRGKLPISAAERTWIMANCMADERRLIGLRDRALLVVMWSCALGRGGLEKLQVSDLSSLRLRRLTAEARLMTLEWVQAAKLESGPLFRGIRLGGAVRDTALSGCAIATIIKDRCAEIGKARSEFSAGSVRRGRVAHEAARGTAVRDILRLAGVKTADAIMRATR